MKLLPCCVLFITFYCIESNAQIFNIETINRQIKEYEEQFDFFSPINAYVSFQQLLANGKSSQTKFASSFGIRQRFSNNELDVTVSEAYKQFLLNQTMKEMITYKDSVAAIITTYQDSLYSFRYFNYEDNQWLNAGEDMANGLVSTRQKIMDNLQKKLIVLRKINEVTKYPTDTTAFVNYLQKNKIEPKLFLLDALEKHKIVVYGEIHRRKISWDLMKALIRDPAFSKNTGTVFMELSSDKQPLIDQFFSNPVLDTESILSIFREMQLIGWYDRGMYEFLIALWELDQSLPEKEKIKVVFADIPMPLSTLKTHQDYQNFINTLKDRNEQMADRIEQFVRTSSDKRNHLFIVGEAHALKSGVIVMQGEGAATNPNSIVKHSAVHQLVERFSNEDIFSTMLHSAFNGKIRGGLFDYAFAQMDNCPVAFLLKDSPFGKEVFDALPDVTFKEQTGSFANNYDGYIFLCALEEEEPQYLLYDIVTDDFVEELKRRATLAGEENAKWFDIPNKMLTKAAIIQSLQDAEKRKRW